MSKQSTGLANLKPYKTCMNFSCFRIAMQTIVLPLDHHQVALLPKSPLTFQRKVATAEARLEPLQVTKIFPSDGEAPAGATAGPSLDS